MSVNLNLPDKVQFLKKDSKVVAINPDIPSWIVTDAFGELILKLFDGKRTTEEVVNIAAEGLGENYRGQIEEFCKNSVQSGLFDEKKPQPRHKDLLNMVHLSLSDRCNLHCVYCYAAERIESSYPRLTFDEYKRLIDEILAVNPQCGFTLTGGEPLLNPLWKDIAKYIKDKGSYSLLLTNGTLITASDLREIKEYFNLVTLSIDGSTRDVHSKSRGDNFDKVLKAAELLESEGIEYSLSMTVSRTNIQDVESAAERFGARLSFAPLFPVSDVTRNRLAITGKEYFSALKQASGVNPLSYCENSLNSARQFQNHKCAIGDGEISVSVTGDVYPCQLLHTEKLRAGNIHKTGIREIYDSQALEKCARLDVDSIEGCSECAFKYICGGACRARAFYETGRLDVSGRFCEYEKSAYLDGIISLYASNALQHDS